MITASRLVIRVPEDLALTYYNLPGWKNIVLRDLTGYFLEFWIEPESYNAANPVTYETKIGYSLPYTTVSKSLYKFEATDTDSRSHLKSRVLSELLDKPTTNLDYYGLTDLSDDCDPNLIAVEDYIVLDTPQDWSRGFTLRVGILQTDPLRGAHRHCVDVCERSSYLITPIEESLTSGIELDSSEWVRYQVLSRFVYGMPTDSVWNPGQQYHRGDRIAAIAPVGGINNLFTKGVRLVFTQTWTQPFVGAT